MRALRGARRTVVWEKRPASGIRRRECLNIVTMAKPQAEPPEEVAVRQSVAKAEQSLYASVLAIRDRHELERLGIAFYDADAVFHAASTMKLAVLLAVFRQFTRGELALEEPVHVRNKFLSIYDRKP